MRGIHGAERPSGLGFRITMLIEPSEIHTDYISCIIKPYANKLHGSVLWRQN